ISAAKKANSAPCVSSERKTTWESNWAACPLLSRCERRTEPTGTDTALRMFVGGSPDLAMGESRWAADTAGNVTPGTADGPELRVTGAGECDERTPMATNTTKMNTASPSTIIAG